MTSPQSRTVNAALRQTPSRSGISVEGVLHRRELRKSDIFPPGAMKPLRLLLGREFTIWPLLRDRPGPDFLISKFPPTPLTPENHTSAMTDPSITIAPVRNPYHATCAPPILPRLCYLP